MSEFARTVRLDALGAAPHPLRIEADEGERVALAARFGLIDIAALAAELSLVRAQDVVSVAGRVTGRAVQRCVATGDPVPAIVDETIALRFVPAQDVPGEIELDAAGLDAVDYRGQLIDVGEAVAESFALVLDPFPRTADADARLREAGVLREGEERSAAFAGLAAMLGTMKQG